MLKVEMVPLGASKREEYCQEIEENKESTTVFTCQVRKLPYISYSYGTSCTYQNKT